MELPFTLFLPAFVPARLIYNDFQPALVAANHLLAVGEDDQDKVSDTHMHRRCMCVSFSSCCQLQLGGLPDSAAYLSTPALPLCSLTRSVSVLLGQMTHAIIARFIKEVQ